MIDGYLQKAISTANLVFSGFIRLKKFLEVFLSEKAGYVQWK